jgi:hypothetical protein
MRSRGPASLLTSWMVASLPRPNLSRALRASATEAPPEGTSHTAPPLKSMPSSRPLVASDTRLIATAISEIVNHSLRRPTKSMLVSPW